jgi:hypothetical protein
VGLCFVVAIGSPIAASLYLIFSPLRKDYESDLDVQTDLTQIGDNSVKGKLHVCFLKRDTLFLKERVKEWNLNRNGREVYLTIGVIVLLHSLQHFLGSVFSGGTWIN